MNYSVYVIDIMKDVSTVVDYLKLGSLHHVRSYFWWGGIGIEQIHKGGVKIEKTHFLIFLTSFPVRMCQ